MATKTANNNLDQPIETANSKSKQQIEKANNNLDQPIEKEKFLEDGGGDQDPSVRTPRSFCHARRVLIVTIVVVIIAIILALAFFFTTGRNLVDCNNYKDLIDANPLPERCGMRKEKVDCGIIGGSCVAPGTHPWQVDLRGCGGTVVDATHVVTAAHCVCERNSDKRRSDVIGRTIAVGNNIALRKGSDECSTQRRSIVKFDVHEKYCGKHHGCGVGRPAYDYDLAVLTVDEPFSFNSFVQPACLPSKTFDYRHGATVVVSGFGVSNLTEDSQIYPDRLQEVEVKLFGDDRCPFKISENMVCAGILEGGKDSCQGDSGGPMVQNEDGAWTLVGVVSWGYGCAEKNQPGVYAKVAFFTDWLSDKLSED